MDTAKQATRVRVHKLFVESAELHLNRKYLFTEAMCPTVVRSAPAGVVIWCPDCSTNWKGRGTGAACV
jgi:hypothetical protein